MIDLDDPDMDVLEALDQGKTPGALPANSLRRLIQRNLLVSRFRGRVLLTGVGRETLLRRRHRLRSAPLDVPESDNNPASGPASD